MLNANGDPLTGVEVSATSIEYQLGQSALVSRARATTDDRGEFRVFGLPPGEYYLKVDNSSRAGRSPGDTPRIVFHPGVLNLSEAKSISIRGQSVNVGDIRIPQFRVFSISGIVADETTGWNERNRPWSYLTPADINNLEESIPVQLAPIMNAGEIPFTIAGIKPGNYFLYAGGSSFSTTPVFMEKTAITIGDHDITGLRIAVKPPIILRARVLLRDDKSAVAMDGIGLGLLPRDRRPINTMTRPNATPLDPLTGESAFTVGNNSSFGIRVYGLYGNAYVADIRQGGRSVFEIASIDANPSAGGVEIEIRTQGGIIQGTVRDTSNQLSQATVVLVPDLGLRRNLDLYRRTLANADGEFSLRGIAPGRYQIFALSETPEGPVDDPAFIGQYEGRMRTIMTSQGATTQTSLRILR